MRPVKRPTKTELNQIGEMLLQAEQDLRQDGTIRGGRSMRAVRPTQDRTPKLRRLPNVYIPAEETRGEEEIEEDRAEYLLPPINVYVDSQQRQTQEGLGMIVMKFLALVAFTAMVWMSVLGGK